ncbi:MAG: SUMF1/EgtB/PvdO family nonheme iron enzyme, partial [Candidatus Methylumidiphilus sp.]
RKRGRMDEALALEILLPVLDGLEEVHRTGFLHRDIKPHNLYLAQSGRTILLDFGAARQAIGENSRSRSVMLTPGYAPFEQYHRRGNQGPWTDVYACAAVLYHMVTGVTPPESTERIEEDSLIDPREINPKLSAGFAETLLQGLALQAKDRPQSVAEFRNLLASPVGVAVGAPAGVETVVMRSGAGPATDETTTRRARAAPPAAPPPPVPAPAAPRKWDLRTGTGLVVLAAIIASYPLLDRLADKLMRRLDAPPPQIRQLPAESSPQAEAGGLPSMMPEAPVAIAKTPAPSINPTANCPYCPKMVWIAGGEFWMGAEDGDGLAQADEQPRHQVRVEDFPLGQYEVTQGQWRQVMGDNPSLFAVCGDHCPVENVSWNDAQAFIEKLNQLSGLRCRLPTEAEWEYACRSGGREQRYCGGDNPDSVGWHEANAKAAHPVGAKLPNALGLYDMSGNVSEWTSSLYQPYPYQGGDGREQRLASGQARVLRGGFWGLPPERSRATARNSSLPDLRNFDLGLRLVCFPPIAGQ